VTTSLSNPQLKVLVILQNAWRREATPGDTQFVPGLAPEHSQQVWEQALWRSHTGKRLREMLPEGCEIVVGNATPHIGTTSREKKEIIVEYVMDQVEHSSPALVVLLGSEAAKAHDLIRGTGFPVITGPHPAWRCLSHTRAYEVREAISYVLQQPEPCGG
jgi:acyl-CoA synthetase (NDP forming)